MRRSVGPMPWLLAIGVTLAVAGPASAQDPLPLTALAPADNAVVPDNGVAFVVDTPVPADRVTVVVAQDVRMRTVVERLSLRQVGPTQWTATSREDWTTDQGIDYFWAVTATVPNGPPDDPQAEHARYQGPTRRLRICADDLACANARVVAAGLDSARATAEVDAALTARYGAAWTTSPQTWLRCPQVEIFLANTVPTALCSFEFRRPGTRRYVGGDATVTVRQGVFRVAFGTIRFYTKSIRRCPRSLTRAVTVANNIRITNRRLSATRSLRCGSTSEGMVGDVDFAAAARWPAARRRVTTGFRGTNRAGFEDQVVFNCRLQSRRTGRRRSYRADCRNRLGDSFHYRFDVTRPRPRARR